MQHLKRGSTFADLIVALTLAVLLIPVVTAAAGRSRETASRVKCASNLKQIGQAILLYGNENGGAYPRTRYRAETADAPTAWSGASSTTPFAADGPAVNDVTAAYRLLLATQDLVPEVFLCTTSRVGDISFARSRFKREHANFLDERELNYSFANPYPAAAVRDAGFELNTKLAAEFAVASDVSPGIALPDNDVTAILSTASARDTRRANSPNHGRDGQNVLYGDGHVEFQQSPFVGLDRDNIFTFGRRDGPLASYGVVGSPAHAADSVLLPTADFGRWRGVERSDLGWNIGLILAAVAGAVALVVLLRSGRRPAPTEWPPLPSS